MPGSWELAESESVMTAILCTETTTMAWSFGFKKLITPGRCFTFSGLPFDHGRNAAVEHFLKGPWEYLFFLDSDVIPPHDAILRLRNHNLPIVSGMYCRRSQPIAIPVMRKGIEWYTDFPKGQLVEVDFVGAGCLLIHRDVLENCPYSDKGRGKRWFDWRSDLAGNIDPRTEKPYAIIECTSEDFSFCATVREKMGLKVIVDTSIECEHIGTFSVKHQQVDPTGPGYVA